MIPRLNPNGSLNGMLLSRETRVEKLEIALRQTANCKACYHSFVITGRDFKYVFSQAVHKMMDAYGVTDAATYEQMLATMPAFLAQWRLDLKKTEIFVAVSAT